MRRTVIIGGPRTGKTTLALQFADDFGCAVHHLDDLIQTHNWSEASEAASHYFDRPGPWIVEGVAAVRALRKWLARSETGKPCDVILTLMMPRVELTKGQSAMAKGVATVWREIAHELVARGVVLQAKGS